MCVSNDSCVCVRVRLRECTLMLSNEYVLFVGMDVRVHVCVHITCMCAYIYACIIIITPPLSVSTDR